MSSAIPFSEMPSARATFVRHAKTCGDVERFPLTLALSADLSLDAHLDYLNRLFKRRLDGV